MRLDPLLPSTPDRAVVLRVAERVRSEGGRLLLVGGFVRDAVLAVWGRGPEPKDLDVEVFGVALPRLRALLDEQGTVDAIGVSFGVLRLRGVDVDFSLPRSDRKTGEGHRGFLVHADPTMSIEDAARRRDFTVNALSYDPLTGELFDPLRGLTDLEQGLLRAADPRAFAEDPLRALRGAQFAARLLLSPAPGLTAQMGAQSLEELPSERVLAEVSKLVLRGVEPSRGLRLLADAGLLSALPGLPGDVLDLAAPALDRWASDGLDRSLAEGLALLLSGEAADPAALLDRLKPSVSVCIQVQALHVALAWSRPPSTDADLRQGARTLAAGGAAWASLLRLRAALHPSDATTITLLTERACALHVLQGARPPAVLGRHALARGVAPGVEMGRLLATCLTEQDRSGEEDPEILLDRALDAPPH